MPQSRDRIKRAADEAAAAQANPKPYTTPQGYVPPSIGEQLRYVISLPPPPPAAPRESLCAHTTATDHRGNYPATLH